MSLRILIMGTPVAPGNRGVMALGASLVQLCTSCYPDTSAAFLLAHKPSPDVPIHTSEGQRMVEVVTCRMSPFVKLEDQFAWILFMSLVYRILPIPHIRSSICTAIPWIKKIVAADIIGDVRGGDSFSDIYGLKRFLLASFVVFSVILVKGRIVHFPQTYGPFHTRTARWIATRLLRCSSAVMARDPESRRIAQSLVGNRLKVGLSPDVAFALHPVAPHDFPPLAEHTVGFNINGLLYNGGYTGSNEFKLKLDYPVFSAGLITALLEDPAVRILLVPHTFAIAGDRESDNEACRLVHASLTEEHQERVSIITGDYDAHQLKGIIRQCDFFIGSRMHSCIAALSQGVPCVGVAYSMKFAGVFDSVGMGEWVVDGRHTDCKEAFSVVLDLYHKRNQVRKLLARNADAARQRLGEIFQEIIAPVAKGT